MSDTQGYAGKLLRVDLSTGQMRDEVVDPATMRKFVGGTGLGAKILYDEVPPGVEWNDPRNRFIVGSGPLGGTRVMGSGTISIVTKGPLTNGATSSASGRPARTWCGLLPWPGTRDMSRGTTAPER